MKMVKMGVKTRYFTSFRAFEVFLAHYLNKGGDTDSVGQILGGGQIYSKKLGKWRDSVVENWGVDRFCRKFFCRKNALCMEKW